MFEIPDLKGLETLDENALKLIKSEAYPAFHKKNETIFDIGTPCTSFLWVVEGSLRVRLMNESGIEMTLYRVTPGQTCILTTSCLLSDQAYNAEAIAETDLHSIAIPQNLFKTLIATSTGFQKLVFENYSNRISGFIQEIANVAYGTLEQRVAGFLFNNVLDGEVEVTHQNIAAELGTSREVISRILKKLEDRRLVTKSHSRIKVLNPELLQRLSTNA